MIAKGEFEVNLAPLTLAHTGQDGIQLGRMSIAKTFRGDLAARSEGEMLTAGTPVAGSAGYVAVEQVAGTLEGRHGTFVLQHFGMLQRGEGRLIVEVVPDSGTGELQNLAGQMTIEIEDGRHLYKLDYTMS
jgi:hypothetical protein